MDGVDKFSKYNKDFEKIKFSISLIEKLMVDFCRKLNNLQFVECATTLKSDKIVADVIKILKTENKEELELFKNFLNKLEKIPELLKKYYNIELDYVVEIITNMLRDETFSYEEKKNLKASEFRNENNTKLKRNSFAEYPKTFSNSAKIDLRNMNLLGSQFVNKQSNSSPVSFEFIDFMDKCTTCIKDILEIFLAHARILLKLRDIYKRYNNSISNYSLNCGSNMNSGINSNSGTFISNNNNNYNPHYQQNLLLTSQNQGSILASRESNTNLLVNNLSNNIASNNNLIHNNNQDPRINYLKSNTVNIITNINSVNNQNSNNCSPNHFYVFNEEEYFDIIEDSEKLVSQSEEILEFYSNIDFLKFSFYEIISQSNEDILTLKCLFMAYHSTLNLDAINSISNMLCARQNIENLKIKFSISNKSFYDLKLYLFYIQFFLDNSHKINFLFKSYFDNKKNQLLHNLQTSNFMNEFKIKDELFCFKTEQYCDRYIKKCNDENIEIAYFMILFEKKKFLDFPEMDNRKLIIRNFYLSKYQMFIDNDDDFGIISIFHTNGEPYKNILNEISKEYKINNNDSKCYFHSKGRINLYKLQLHSISNYIFIAIKYKEKSQDSNTVENICKDMRYRFTDMHIFKTLFL